MFNTLHPLTLYRRARGGREPSLIKVGQTCPSISKGPAAATRDVWPQDNVLWPPNIGFVGSRHCLVSTKHKALRLWAHKTMVCAHRAMPCGHKTLCCETKHCPAHTPPTPATGVHAARHPRNNSSKFAQASHAELAKKKPSPQSPFRQGCPPVIPANQGNQFI